MSKLRVNCFSISLDGFGAGPNQSLENPLGEGGPQLHNWFYPTETFQKMVLGQEHGAKGIDNDFAARGFENVGAWIMGRNMFAHSRGPWTDDGWKGWWDDNPPYHCDVYVLTHHPRAPLGMEGGTTFHFVTDGIDAALKRAKASAKDKDVRIGGGAATIREYLKAGLVDEMHISLAPVLLGKGEPLFHGIDLTKAGLKTVEQIPGENTVHYVLKR
ncbi:MAG TPA: dihydrofolate reductase family protein [Hyphomonadaceae bacterium]|jgi:dihydrofolate reductase|nr:dihydrofolate reductase family protein [Hyphomonadaceae bacterium]HPN06053.1 dihydrofolate reductase family protein [Hyphomonadaceae bacterium]